jgi:hypothetical protein
MPSRFAPSNVVTVNDVLEGHTLLDIESLDRIYLNAYVPNLQVSPQVVAFLHDHLGNPIASPALFEKIGTSFRTAMKTFAARRHIPWIQFTRDNRKIDIMRPYLDRAARENRPGVVAIGVAQEFQRVFTARRCTTSPGLPPRFWFDKTERRVTCYYVYLWDDDFGPAFIKICSYFPYPIKVWVNGHEWAKRQATKARIPFAELSNGFASTEDAQALQTICDQLSDGTITQFFERWMIRIPLPLTRADRAAGYWWELSMRQIEVSRTIVFEAPRHARGFFEALIADNIDLGRPEHVEIIFDRRVQRNTQGVFKTAIDRFNQGVTINVFYKHSRIKQYLKDGRALRIETVINSPTDLGCQRRLHNLGTLQAKARACNRRLLYAERAGQGCVLANSAFERIPQPSVTDEGRRAPAMRFGDPRVMALASALCCSLFAVTGITNKGLRAQMSALLGAPYTMNQASYDLARLRLNGVLTRVPRRNLYVLTPDGLSFAIFFTKVHDRVLRPLLANDQPQAPPALRAALRSIELHVDDCLTRSRLPRAA